MKIEDVMTRDPSCVSPDSPARDAARLMQREDVGLVPVVEGSRLVGVVTDRDIAIRVVADGRDGEIPVRQVMSTRDIVTCSPDEDVSDAMESMASEQVRRIPIVDERGSLVGIVSQADIARTAGDSRDAGATVERISRPGGQHRQ